MQQIPDAKVEAKRPALLRLAFRPFFLLGSIFAVLAILRWVAILQGWSQWQGQLPVLFWHAHEMIFGFVLAIILGFLLTAVQTWTGVPGLRGKALGFLVASWLCARTVFWFSPKLPWIYYWIPDALLILSASYFLARPIIARRQWKNLPFVPILLIFALLHSGVIFALASKNFLLVRELLSSSLWLVVLLVCVMGARVIPFFTARRWNCEQRKESVWLSLLVVFGFILVILPPSLINLVYLSKLKTIALAFLGIALSFRLYQWRNINNWQEPLLWSLHLSYAAIALGCLILAFSTEGSLIYTHAPHLIALAGIGGIILAMIARVSLGHTGQELKLRTAMPWAFALIFFSALLRFLGPIFEVQYSKVFYLLAGSLFALGFIFYLWHYSNLLSKARTDGRPG